jgi:hypothetical protein
MHLFDAGTDFYGGNAIVGGGLPLAGGLALADRMRGADNVTACFFGEGAVAEGEFHETMNLAALWRLPVLFVCENNGYAMGSATGADESVRPTSTPRPPPTASPSKPSTAWTWSPSRPPRAARWPNPRDRQAGISSNAAPTASAPIRCSMPSSTATRTRSRNGAPGADRALPGLAAGERADPRQRCRRDRGERPMPRSPRPWPLPRPAPGSRWKT